MKTRGTRLLKATILMLLIAVTLTAQPAFATTAGSGGWYWPTGSEDFGGMGGWWQSRGGDTRHLAQDMAGSCGKPVYAVSSGVVLESRFIGGYGPGGGSGGAVVILHRTATGLEFKALYGHLKNLRYSVGDTVAAGAVIGLINGCSPNHVHFGIHPGRAYPSDGNVFRGHTYDSSIKYGWVDPIAYLRNNPRVIPYRAPAIPVSPSAGATATYVSRSVPHTTPPRGTLATIVGSVRNSVGRPFIGARVSLERWTGTTWVRVGSALTGIDGIYHASYAPSASTILRVHFVPPADYAESTSATVTIVPHVAMSSPARSTASPRRGAAFLLASRLTPRHTPSTIVEFRLQRKFSGTWRNMQVKRARISDSAGGSTCVASTACFRTGEWRVRTYTPSDSLHAASVSAWSRFVVR